MKIIITIQLTDGKHTVQGTVNIHIVPVNDEKPLLLKNAGLEVDVAENKVISSVLLEAEDKDTPRERLLYIINTSPAFGQLHLKMPSGWVPLHPGMNFTQEEVDMNRLWYLHTTILGSKGHDSFCFYLTDLENQSPPQSFYISLRNTHKGDIVLLTRSVTLTEGDRVTLTTDVLLATDGTGKAEELLYAISVPPAHGHIEYINYPGVPIAGFSQLDVAAQKVCYVHDNSHEALADSFSFVVSNGLTTRNGSLKFVIEHMDRVPPTLLSNKGLQLLEGAMVTITSEVLELTDPDTVVGNLTYSITQQPRHGRLFLKGKALPMGRFTQTDVNDLDLTYQHNGGQAEIDQFTFAASDGTNEGFLLYGQLRKEPVVFTIQVDHIDKSSPRIVTKGRPSTVEGLKDGRFVIYITARSLKAMDQDSKDEELDFTILRPPHSGYLENAITGEYVKGRFTQRDLNLRSIRYVINPSIEVTGDSFEFRVSDPAGNAMLPEVMELTWSRIELAAQCFRVCENVGTLSIQVVRSGNSEDPSYIGIQVQEDSAKVGRDFTHSSASLIQFDPGVSTKTWNIFLKDDGLEENNEKFKIQLRVPKNAILGQKDKASVEIIDPRGGSCDPEELRPDGNVEMSFIPAVDRPSKGRSSVSHPEKGSSSKREEPWERYASPPRGDVPQTDHYLDYSGGVVQEEVSRPQMRKHLQVVGSSRRVRPSGVERKNEETVWTFHGIIPLRVEEKSVAVPVQPSSFQTDLHVPHSWSWQPSSLHLNRGGEIPQGDSPPVYISAPAILSTSVDNSSCPPGWTLHGKYCYSLSPSYLATWERAEKDCRLMFQSHLVSVHSEKEIKWLWKFAGKLPFWIGLTDQGEPGRWVWTNGRPVSFTKLKQGAKSSEGGAVSRCVLMQDKKRWILRSCNMRKERFVCSLPALRH